MKVKKVCKCGRVFYDTENNRKCPTCVMKRNVKVSRVAVGAIAVGAVVKKHSKEIKEVAKKVGDVVIKLANK